MDIDSHMASGINTRFEDLEMISRIEIKILVQNILDGKFYDKQKYVITKFYHRHELLQKCAGLVKLKVSFEHIFWL